MVQTVLPEVSAASQVFQVKDLIMFEVQEVVNTLYSSLCAMAAEAGDSLKKFCNNFDKGTCQYKVLS
ncbi:hypothetical protein ACF0H5_018257 [Mactra antiquata]